MKRFLSLALTALGLSVFSWWVQRPQHTLNNWTDVEYTGPLNFFRTQFLANLSGVTLEAKGLVAGLAIGDKSMLPSDLTDNMKVVSLTHLTAVSGANCAIVIGVLYLVLGRAPIERWARVVFSLAALSLYVLLVGPQPSVLRAALMAALILFSNLLGRSSSGNQVLALSVIILLIADPWLATNFGFQLSVLATFGILELAPRLAQRISNRVPSWLAVAVSVSVSAQLLCLPVLLELQSGISTYSLPANLLAEPLVAPITVLGILACVFAPILPSFASLLTWLASIGAWLIIRLADFFANSPAATLSWPAGLAGSLMAAVLVVLCVILVRTDRARVRNQVTILLVAIIAIALGNFGVKFLRGNDWPASDWAIISCDVGQGDATLIRSAGHIALIDVGRKPTPIRNCLNHLNIKHIDLLVLTHFDLDHVGGLDGALAGTSVESAMITSFHDERPAAAITWRKLSSHAKVLYSAETNMEGSLGNFRWKVLSPHRGAPEAEDSNDGSVTMLFESRNVDVLTLADLGEKGQMRLAAESSGWLGTGFGGVPLVVKVSHHGSADQYPELYESLHPSVALISVGAGNHYGHPTARTLKLLNYIGASTYRTDLDGAIAVSAAPEGLRVNLEGHG